MKEAMRRANKKTKRETVEEALKMLIRLNDSEYSTLFFVKFCKGFGKTVGALKRATNSFNTKFLLLADWS